MFGQCAHKPAVGLLLRWTTDKMDMTRLDCVVQNTSCAKWYDKYQVAFCAANNLRKGLECSSHAAHLEWCPQSQLNNTQHSITSNVKGMEYRDSIQRRYLCELFEHWIVWDLYDASVSGTIGFISVKMFRVHFSCYLINVAWPSTPTAHYSGFPLRGNIVVNI